MRVVLPSNQQEITLGEFQDYLLLLTKVDDLTDDEFNNKKISIFCDIDEKTLTRVPKKDIDGLLEQIDIALSVTVDFKDRFTLNGIEFGFIPNFDDITPNVFASVQRHSMDTNISEGSSVQELCNSYVNMHKAMSVLFRPITEKHEHKPFFIVSLFKRLFKLKQKENRVEYQIETYKDTKKYGDVMKDMPLCYVNAAMVFFSSLAKELRLSIQKSTKEVQAKEQQLRIILESGDGMQRQ